MVEKVYVTYNQVTMRLAYALTSIVNLVSNSTRLTSSPRSTSYVRPPLPTSYPLFNLIS